MRHYFCNRLLEEKNVLSECSECEKLIPSTCFEIHEKKCRFKEFCTKCNQLISAKNIKQFKKMKQKHICHSIRCKVCYEIILLSEKKNHICKMKKVIFPAIFHRLGKFILLDFSI